MSDEAPGYLPLETPSAERCAALLHIDATGQLVPDPASILGLSQDQLGDADAVRAAWVAKIQEHPPEKDPEGARRLREARDRLLEPERLLERLLGRLHVPSAESWGLPVAAASAEASASGESGERLDARSRILGQAVLYTLVEDTFVKAQGG